MESRVIALTNEGWKHIQLKDVAKLQKSWEFEGELYRVDAFFGTMCTSYGTPAVVMNVYRQGAGTREVVDDNCDVWNNIFTTTTKQEGNEFFKYLKKHGFEMVY